MGLTGYVVFDLVVWLLAAAAVAFFVGGMVAHVREQQVPREDVAAELARITAQEGWWKA